MFTLRHLLLFSFLALLSGCARPPCAAPDDLADRPARSCFYQLRVTDINLTNYHVTAKLPERIYARGYKGNKKNEQPTKESKYRDRLFTFRVTDLDKLVAGSQLQVNNTYDFVRQANSIYLELLPGGSCGECQ